MCEQKRLSEITNLYLNLKITQNCFQNYFQNCLAIESSKITGAIIWLKSLIYKNSKAFESFWMGMKLFLDEMSYTFKMCRNKKFYIAAKPVRNKLCMHVYCMETTINTKDKDGTWLQKHCKAWLETITLVFIFFLPIFCTISIIYKLLNSLPFNFGRELNRYLYTSTFSYEQPMACNNTNLMKAANWLNFPR